LKQEPKDDPKKFRLRSSLLEASFWNRRLWRGVRWIARSKSSTCLSTDIS
jgi:hypothetical protein